jgi:PAS domain S-box-containing protein
MELGARANSQDEPRAPGPVAGGAVVDGLAEVLDSISDCVMRIDRNWTFSYLNRAAWEEIAMGRDLIGVNVMDAFPGFERSSFHEIYQQVMDDGKPRNIEAYLDLTGEWYDARVTAVKTGIGVCFRCVSGERERRERGRYQNALLDAIDQAVIATDLEGRITYWNRFAERLYGWKAQDVHGRSIFEITPAPELVTQAQEIMASLAAGRSWSGEYLVRRRDGSTFPAFVTDSPLYDEKGAIVGIVGISQDISEDAERRAQLEARDRFYRDIFRSLPVALYKVDKQGYLTFFNEAAATLWGREPLLGVERWCGAWRLESPDGQELQPGHCPMAIAVREGRQMRDVEAVAIRPDGTRVPFIATSFPIFGDHGEIVGGVNTLVDVTELKEAEQRTRASQRLEVVGQLTGGIAHDFNNLLTVIIGNVEALVERLDRDRVEGQMAELTLEAAERAAELTKRLLAFARRQPLAPRPTEIQGLLEGMVPLIRRSIGEEIDLRLVCEPGLLNALVDPVQLEQAILNLCINSRDAMPKGGSLSIRAAPGDPTSPHLTGERRCIVIEVSDTGEGMTEQILARAIEPFFTTKEVGKGSGLGLPTTYGFVKQSGGELRILSRPAAGTSVQLFLPAVAEGSGASSSPAPLPLPGGRERILVVEDEDFVRESVARQLRSLGYSIECVASGTEARTLLREQDGFDLVFTDVIMPGGMNGRELAEEVWKELPHLPFLFTSGYAETTLLENGRLGSGIHLLSKPYRKKQLAEKIRTVLKDAKPAATAPAGP